ncbi:phosphatase [Candidatus Woesearchaeota archaeon]|nr:MAG: phosphatase [Candidatus Woesearchaeota archaeon ex4484_78]RLE47008.1 MAG: phosphatase [Candidatus Woesearchaeota archaeon]
MKAVLFDLDGVIVDSRRAHVLSFQKVLKEKGVSISFSELKKFFGVLDVDIFKRLIKKKKIKASALELSKKRRKIASSFFKNIKLFSGVKSLLKKLKNKYLIGLATSSSFSKTEFILETFKLKEYFDAVVVREDVKKHKPDPEVYLKLAKKLKVKPEECVVIEDSVAGVEAARRAGMFCVAVLNSFPKKMLHADLLVKKLNDKRLLRLLGV